MGRQVYEDERREYRRKRRRKNQRIAYLAAILLMIGVAAGGIYGVKQLVGVIQEKQEQARLEKEQEAAEEAARIAAEEAAAAAEAQAALEETQPEEEPVTVYTQEDVLDQIVDSVLSGMTLEEKVAGLFIVRPESVTDVSTVIQAGEGTKEALDKYPVGGMIYFDQNIKDEEQLKKMLGNTAAYSKYPIFLGVDEEGGKVARVAKALELEEVPSMGEIGKTEDAAQAYTVMQKVGGYLSSYGFNLDFAPVADVLTMADNKTIGDRSFGTDAALVGPMVAQAVAGLQDVKVSACLKHFPGLGSTSEDTHDGTAVSDRTLEELRAEEFVAFQAGIEAGANFVMVSHVSLPQVTGDNTPASLSYQVVTELLRNELGFSGIIITDALDMEAVTKGNTAAEAAVKAIQAGNDMLLMPESFTEAYEGVLQAISDGTLTEERINESMKRILAVKYAGTVEEEGGGLISEEDAAAADEAMEDGTQEEGEDGTADTDNGSGTDTDLGAGTEDAGQEEPADGTPKETGVTIVGGN